MPTYPVFRLNRKVRAGIGMKLFQKKRKKKNLYALYTSGEFLIFPIDFLRIYNLFIKYI